MRGADRPREDVTLPPGVARRVRALCDGARIVEVRALAPDAARADPTGKAQGYGLPRRIRLRHADGRERNVVFRTAASDDFGHDRRSDRALGMILAHDTFGAVPRHVRALDVGTILDDGRLESVREGGEFYLVTEWAPGRPYARDLRRIAAEGRSGPADVKRCEALARYLVELHARRGERRAGYTRAIRDLVGHGEGVFGMVDGYPSNVPGAPHRRLRAIEEACVGWRWRLRGYEGRLRRTHGDFHPFNVVFDRGEDFVLLDASRGGRGDPADDVTCMAINYVFFALDRRESWKRGLAPLWRAFWRSYLEGSGDRELLQCAAPFLAWRGLVLACPRFYPGLAEDGRDRLLGLVERALAAPRFDPDWADALFA
jgi:aminoglycoside phosphotransferase (APT) family kinase protein